MPRRKRVLEVLEVAPPLEPRKPSAAELALQEENDQRVIALLKYRLEPILSQLKRKFKRFTKRATEEYAYAFAGMEDVHPHPPLEVLTTTVEVQTDPNGSINIMEQEHLGLPLVNGHVNGVTAEPEAPAAPAQRRAELYDMDLERMHTQLYKGRYLTPQDFLDDVGKIVPPYPNRSRSSSSSAISLSTRPNPYADSLKRARRPFSLVWLPDNRRPPHLLGLLLFSGVSVDADKSQNESHKSWSSSSARLTPAFTKLTPAPQCLKLTHAADS
ncbi:hypothetical protein B0H16DRAFT_1709422 [Mycena metata]|uniref:Uncharacterized protein n=1 Tax=Mycena metata TaxID=1033252 RepID=A0AAD7KHF2_9AGAR|nr:hypothetical protein B0H16DRAFT_1709422 [Mycena metata]